jgi:hypothetical protein
MRARTGLWEPRVGNDPGPPGPTQIRKVVGQFEPTRYLPETSAMKSATKRWISAGGRL